MFLNGLSIIIPTKDRGNVFYNTLSAAYNASNHIDCEIIIINDSKTNNVDIDDIFKDRVRVINNPKGGVASARNLGAKNANYSNFLFLDDDIIISDSNIAELFKNVEQYPDSAINFNWIYPPELSNKIITTQFGRYLIKNGFTTLKGWASKLTWNDKEIFEVDLVASYFLFINKDNFNIVGGYNESFPHAGAEDFDFAMRLKKSEVKGLCNPLSTVFHNESDRIDLIPWIQRKERSAETRKIAADMGYREMAIETSNIKIKIIKGLYQFKSILFFILKVIPNNKLFDKLYFKIIDKLLAVYLHKGYFK